MTDTTIKESLWTQFGASIDMLEHAIELCPAEEWNTSTKFWYNTYHCLFFTDYYLSMQPKDFAPPPPFSFSEFDDELPERVYSKDELLGYLAHCRNKCRTLIAGLTTAHLSERWINSSGSMNYAVLEIQLYNMRHVQHHAAQLNLLLRQAINDAPDWVFRSKEKL